MKGGGRRAEDTFPNFSVVAMIRGITLLIEGVLLTVYDLIKKKNAFSPRHSAVNIDNVEYRTITLYCTLVPPVCAFSHRRLGMSRYEKRGVKG